MFCVHLLLSSFEIHMYRLKPGVSIKKSFNVFFHLKHDSSHLDKTYHRFSCFTNTNPEVIFGIGISFYLPDFSKKHLFRVVII